MKIWKVILATLVIFSAGVFTGALVTAALHRARAHAWREIVRQPQPNNPIPPAPNVSSETNRGPKLTNALFGGKPPFRSKEFLERLDQELKLEADQRKRTEKIIEESQKRNKEFMRDEWKRFREQLRDVLTPEQNKHLEELMKRPPKPPKEGQPTNAAPPSSAESSPNPPAAESPAKP